MKKEIMKGETALDAIVNHIYNEYYLKKFEGWDDLVVKIETRCFKADVVIKNFRQTLNTCVSEEDFSNFISFWIGKYVPYVDVNMYDVVELTVSCKMLSKLVVLVGKEM